ncbi:hypothetical protein FIU87_19450 [Bacillus sp. THAF10]|uniref:DUF4304 domain-containing protein n=1 Tax=Bacillus sp. THAF10 TaxID=2587848 RepID=UPI001268AD61|nr:DUF4304 domain-containing protein [Bacillus sp. THAF10]QFT90826.1 hypothetical protein FIU87_19450 [Bacillus sp. THAF10]
MTKEELVKFLDGLFKTNSFIKKGRKWTMTNDELIKIIILSRSRFGNYYYLDYGITIKNIELDGLVMHIYHSLGSLNGSDFTRMMNLLNLDTSITDKDRKEELENLIQNEIFTFFSAINNENDLLSNLKNRENLNDVPLCVKKYYQIK